MPDQPLDQPSLPPEDGGFSDDVASDEEGLPNSEEADSPASMPFLDHLEELRWRLLKSILAVVVFSAVAFGFAERLMRILTKPLGDYKLHVTEVTGSFYAFIKVAIIFGIAGALPVIFYQLWRFISPGLYRRERMMIIPVILISTLLFLIGSGFCYFVVLPMALQFLIGFGGDILNPIITVGSYISFAGLLLLAFGLGFQLPIIAYFLGKLGLVNSRMLSKGRRYAIVLILIVAAVLTPTPDAFTQLLLAVPLYLLYEISIIVVRTTGRKQ